MFNHGRFNRKHYNLPEKSADIVIRDKLIISVVPETRAGENLVLDETLKAMLFGKSYSGKGVNAAFNGKETAGSYTFLTAVYGYVMSASCAWSALISSTVNCSVSWTARGAVLADNAVREDGAAIVPASSALRCSAELGTDYPMEYIYVKGALYSMVSTAYYDIETMTVNIQVPAGSKLIVDSGDMTVKLVDSRGNETNVLYAHEGDWPTINKDTTKIFINISGRAIVDLEYTELFL